MHQEEIEALFSKRQIHTVLHESIRHELDTFLINWSLRTWYAIDRYLEGVYYESKNVRIALLKKYVEKKGIEDLLVKIIAAVIHTQGNQTYQQCIGYLQAFLPHKSHIDRAITAGELIALGTCKGGLYEIVHKDREQSVVQVNHWDLVDDYLLSHFEWINSTTYNLPLVKRPKPVTSNQNCGYHTINEPLILGDLTYHDEPQNMIAINILNEIEWVLDPHVLKEPEVPAKPLADAEAHENFAQMCAESQYVYSLLGQEPFWFAWQYDCRGRMYSHGYHVNLQSFEYKKALLNFNHYESLTGDHDA